MIGRLAAPASIARANRHEVASPTDLFRLCLAAALTIGGGTHLMVGIQHGVTNFALLSLKTRLPE